MELSVLQILKATLYEDAPKGDLTTQCLDAPTEEAHGFFVAKQDLIWTGSEFIRAVEKLGLGIHSQLFFKDSQKVLKGQKIVQLDGPWAHLLLVERSLLNILGHLCGVATQTHLAAQEIRHTSCQILDTRKTTPFFRTYEKKAVRDGGGQNHRMGLSDQIMFKENHILMFKKPFKEQLIETHQKFPGIKITVECQTLEQVKEACEAPIQQILLDNMSTEDIQKAVELIPAHIASEASGNMTLERLKRVAETGVNFISMGAITHSAPVADISFLLN